MFLVKKFKNFLLRFTAGLTGSMPVQIILAFNARVSHYLMGIGSGSAPHSSGELSVMQFVRRNLIVSGRSLCAFDVGANNGQFLALLTKALADEPSEIHAFEPGQTAFGRLHAAFNHSPGIQLNNFGLSNEVCEAWLYSDTLGTGMSSTLRRDTQHLGIVFTESEQIELTTLDSYCAANAVKIIDFLKVDVEGAELAVLNGGRRMFEEGRVRTVLFEFGGCNIDARTFFRDFFRFFRGHRGRIFRITPSGYLSPISCYTESLEQFMTTNFFVVLDENVRVK